MSCGCCQEDSGVNTGTTVGQAKAPEDSRGGGVLQMIVSDEEEAEEEDSLLFMVILLLFRVRFVYFDPMREYIVTLLSHDRLIDNNR